MVVRGRVEMDRIFAFDIHDGRISTVRAVLKLGKLRYLDQARGGDIQ